MSIFDEVIKQNLRNMARDRRLDPKTRKDQIAKEKEEEELRKAAIKYRMKHMWGSW